MQTDLMSSRRIYFTNFKRSVIGLLLLIQIVLFFQIPTISAESKDKTSYPTTPRGVVEAFIKASLIDVTLPVEKLGVHSIPSDERYKYLTANRPDAYSWDCLDIGIDHEIKEIKKDRNKVRAKVLYKRLGRLCDTFYISGKNKTVLSTAKKIKKDEKMKEDYKHLLYLTNDTQEVNYLLIKKNNIWKIDSLWMPTYISVSAAIKQLEFRLHEYPHIRKVLPTEEEKKEIKEAIIVLEKYQIN